MMKILVIGSKGFIGSHCIDYFSKYNEVWGCDVVIDFNATNYISIETIDSDFLELFSARQFDVCINCSGAASVPFSIEKPLNDFNLNTLNVCKILESIRRFNPLCKYISMSSAAVYGNPNHIPINEDMPLSPVSPYGYHKVMAEMLCEEYSRFCGVKTCCLRIFSAYGPRLKKQLFWDMYQKFVNNDVVELWGTGKETRDFVYITDLMRIIELTIMNAKFEGEKINAANGVQKRISDVATAFVKALGVHKDIRFNGAERKGDPINWEANIDTILSWGYRQSVLLEDGIKNYITWIRDL